MRERSNGFSVTPYIDSFAANSTVTVFPLENRDTLKICCWYPARQPADRFVRANNLAEPDEKLFSGARPSIMFFIPMNQQCHVVKTVKLRGAATVERVLQALQIVIKDAIDYYIGVDTRESVEMYEKFITCHLMISRAGGHLKAYVRTPQ